MLEKLTPYLRKQQKSPSIYKQYIAVAGENHDRSFGGLDPLSEDSKQPVKGLVHKYENRALVKVSYRCAAHCQFCTRIRQIGTADGDLSSESLSEIINYIKRHPEISDVILSGGDPFYTPKVTSWLLKELENLESVKVIRIGTRMPVQSPISFNSKLIINLLNEVSRIARHKPFYILINFEHPDELTTETKEIIQQLRNTGATLLAQTVFLKGINDDFETLKYLFEQLYFVGVQPYYLYRCDYVKGLEHFVCSLDCEVEIATKLRKSLSGIANPTYIVDVEGTGKIPLPLNFWDRVDLTSCHDFTGESVKI
jgi:lysine 2,3-aminomutase